MGQGGGIDLGATYSAIALIGTNGRPEVLVYRDGGQSARRVRFGRPDS